MTVQTTRTSQLRTYEFQEEKQAWMLLIRQAILDCQYLDKAADECVVPQTHTILTPVDRSTASPVHVAHAVTFSKSILLILNEHNKLTFTRCIESLVHSITTLSCTEMAYLCDMKSDQALQHTYSNNIDTNPFTRTNTRSRDNSSISLNSELDPRSVCSYPDPYLARTAVGQRTALVKSLLDRMGDIITSCFSDICADYKPVIEICDVASSVMQKNKNKNENEKDICYSSLLVQDFIDGVCGALEKISGVSTSDQRRKDSTEREYRDNGQYRVRIVYCVLFIPYISYLISCNYFFF